jgi:hypothetical protein
MTNYVTTRFSAELASASSCTSIIMSGDVDGYGLEQLLETAQRYARRVSVRLEGGETEGALRLLQRRLAGLSRRGIEVTFARA